jgi:4-hydroxybenzoate polyprenyltransferase
MASIAGFTVGFIIIHMAEPSATFLQLLDKYFWQFLLGIFVPFFMVGAAQAINDVYDLESDRKNKRYDRPLVRGDLDPVFVKWFSTALLLSGPVLAGLLFGPVVLIVSFFFAGLAFWYSAAGLKQSGVLGNIAVSSGYTAPMVLAAISIEVFYPGQLSPELVLTVIVMILITLTAALGREFMKGIMDVEGDRAADVKTVAVVYGSRTAATLSVIFFLLTLVLIPVPLFLSFKNSWMYAGLMSFMIFFLIYTIYLLVKSPTAEIVKKTRFLTRYAFYVGSAAFLAAGFFIAV